MLLSSSEKVSAKEKFIRGLVNEANKRQDTMGRKSRFKQGSRVQEREEKDKREQGEVRLAKEGRDKR